MPYFILFVSYAGLVHHVTDVDCWAQNGSTHGRVLATFKRRSTSLLKKEKSSDEIAVFVLNIPLLFPFKEIAFSVSGRNYKNDFYMKFYCSRYL